MSADAKLPKDVWLHLNELHSAGGRKEGQGLSPEPTPLMTDEGDASPSPCPPGHASPRALAARAEVTDNMQRQFCNVEKGKRLSAMGMYTKPMIPPS
eukprot:7201590-Pyramimonas_sp.AAC.1